MKLGSEPPQWCRPAKWEILNPLIQCADSAISSAANHFPPPPPLHREDLARRLCLHLAAVNRVPDALLGDSDAVLGWAQEVYSRAYALHVLARWGS